VSTSASANTTSKLQALKHPRFASAFFFALAALGPIGSWVLLLFGAQPEKLQIIEAATQTARFLFSGENEHRLWFFGWSLLPVLLLLVAASHVAPSWRRLIGPRRIFYFSMAVAAFSLLFWLQVSFLAACGAYFAFRARGDA